MRESKDRVLGFAENLVLALESLDCGSCKRPEPAGNEALGVDILVSGEEGLERFDLVASETRIERGGEILKFNFNSCRRLIGRTDNILTNSSL